MRSPRRGLRRSYKHADQRAVFERAGGESARNILIALIAGLLFGNILVPIRRNL